MRLVDQACVQIILSIESSLAEKCTGRRQTCYVSCFELDSGLQLRTIQGIIHDSIQDSSARGVHVGVGSVGQELRAEA